MALCKWGVKWPVPRFTDNDDGTITDNLTRLVWLKNASCWQAQHWFSALDAAYNLKDGDCGLSDNSVIGDWRVPNRNELLSLVDVSIGNPCFPPPFEKMWEGRYWTSITAINYFSQQAWVLFPWDGSVSYAHKTFDYYYLLPVRSGN